MKTCSKCLVEKIPTEFSKDKSRKDGLNYCCKSCERLRGNVYREPIQKEINTKNRASYAANPEEKNIKNRVWHENNKDDHNVMNAINRELNLDRYAAYAAKYRAKKIQATPAWADQEGIKDFYFSAKTLTDLFHKPYHVDHIVPLQSKLVCGLHVPVNLQVLLGADNLSKRNCHWPDMP